MTSQIKTCNKLYENDENSIANYSVRVAVICKSQKMVNINNTRSFTNQFKLYFCLLGYK